jgi:DNA-binding transcriptional regulator YiaG
MRLAYTVRTMLEHLTDIPDPEPHEIVGARQASGLTQAQAAEVVGLSAQPRWAEYEAGRKRMPGQRWALFLLMTDQHPRLKLVRRRGNGLADQPHPEG